MKLLVIKIDDELCICDRAGFTQTVEPKAIAAIRRGGVVTWNDGRSQWIRETVVAGDTPGSYVWHRDGNRVSVRRDLMTAPANGGPAVVSSSAWTWRHYDKI